MITHVIIKFSKDDGFDVQGNDSNKVLKIPSFIWKPDRNIVNHDIATLLKNGDLRPDENAIDFANLSLATYTIDQQVSRKQHGYKGWSRYFKLYIPVLNTQVWNENKEQIESFLSFLSGDKWELNFRERSEYYEDYSRTDSEIEIVSLFSGGMDSFIGSVDLIENHNKIALVAHHKSGGVGEKKIQDKLVKKITSYYSNKEVFPFLFHVQAPKKNSGFLGEESQRARSILFITLGLIVANSIGNETTLVIPENGLISLNVPLTKTRYGSHSTRTTHPNYIYKLNELLSNLGINNKLTNPYRFKTKGEMIQESSNFPFVKEHLNFTISCSKAGHYLQWKRKQQLNCGHCVPCMIRRSAMHLNSIDVFTDNYVHDVRSSTFSSNSINIGADLKAFKIGWLQFNSNQKDRVFQLLKSGSIPVDDDDELAKYVSVYERGMKEVANFLSLQNDQSS